MLGLIPLVYMFILYAKFILKTHRVEFDDEFLYVIHKKGDILIPLENICSVEIVSLGGVYKVNLYYEDILGSYFYFKPSVLYPLNYKSKDALVDLLRDKIDHAKRTPKYSTHNRLPS